MASTSQLPKRVQSERYRRQHPEGARPDPLNFDVIRRYQALTGTAAVLADIDETFEQIAARRREDERR